MRAMRSLLLGVAGAALWPLYLVLLAYAARVAPWPRSLAILVSAVCSGLAIAMLVHELLRWLARPRGWIERHLEIPPRVVGQLGRSGRFLAIAAAIFLVPAYLFDHGLIAPEGRPLAAPATVRMLFLGFELSALGTLIWLLRHNSALLDWLGTWAVTREGLAPGVLLSRLEAARGWVVAHRRALALVLVAAVAADIALDVRGYSFTARRLASGGSESLVAILLAVALYRAAARAIASQTWDWTAPRRSWARVLKSKVGIRSSRRRGAPDADPSAPPPEPVADPALDAVGRDDLDKGLCRLAAGVLSILTLISLSWIWDVDLALVRFLLGQTIWSQSVVTVGDLATAAATILLAALAWRYMNALFAILIFPRITNDPGVRFAIITLCRYAVLGLAALGVCAAIHLDLAKISVVLAALGVGLGFGLQEIVSNFVCGIILLLERPIRIGDTVTVAGNTGKVDQIKIRATTIVNPDNQSMIVPNREFITGNLVNWTHKDRILRVLIKVGVAYGTDPERVVELLLLIARADGDVLANPAPGASLDGFGDSSLLFSLAVFVPDPSLAGAVRHRLCSEIQRQFASANIQIPYPTTEFHLGRLPRDVAESLAAHRDLESRPGPRRDPATRTPPPPVSGLLAGRLTPLTADHDAPELR